MISKPTPPEDPSGVLARDSNAPACPVTPIALVGAGVVGRAILDECVRHGLPVWLLDLDAAALQRATEAIRTRHPGVSITRFPDPFPGVPALRIDARSCPPASGPPRLMIESIAENLAAKRACFASATATWGRDCILATNTSNLRVAEIFDGLPEHPRCLGMHFFMPVASRPLVELIPRQSTEPAALQSCRDLAARLGKRVLVTGDQPGFVVNRLLAPYLNQALLLLGRGVTAEMLEAAAREFGMPISPLELIDRIGIRTAFDSGRVFWRAFPKRIDPAPILPGMIKANRLGAAAGGGFFEPLIEEPAGSSPGPLHPRAQEVIARYTREPRVGSAAEVIESLAIPMWIEAAQILADRVVGSLEEIELAVAGGLGFQGGFYRFFDAFGCQRLREAIAAAGDTPALTAPDRLIETLASASSPAAATLRYAGLGDAPDNTHR